MSKKLKHKYSTEELSNFVKNSECWSDVCRKAGVTICTFNFKRMQSLCAEHGITHKHFDIKKTFKRNKKYWTEESLFVENSTASRAVLRNYIKRHSMIKEQCAECDLKNTWNGKSIKLELDHINGDCSDNRFENLRFLCPNCHSQTPTFKKGKVS